MAKAWMKQDQAPQAEALETWNTLEAEFNEERKAMLMASAETDAIKEAMNKKFGSGTVKYGSEIKQPEMKTPQAIFEFSQRNPAADGGRMGFSEGKGKFKSGESFKTESTLGKPSFLINCGWLEIVDICTLRESIIPSILSKLEFS